MIGDREFEFDENDPIFYVQRPKNSSEYHNTNDGCNTCGTAWVKTSDLQNSHCHFCGISNCKNCMKKTRKFYQDRRSSFANQQNPGESDVLRGKICKVCDRKFFIKGMVQESSKQIKAQNLAIQNSLRQHKDWMN